MLAIFTLIPKKILFYACAGILLAGVLFCWIRSLQEEAREGERRKQIDKAHKKVAKARQAARRIDADASIGEQLSHIFSAD